MYSEIHTYLNKHSLSDGAAVPAERKALLDDIAAYVGKKIKENKDANLIFICTHNSRRSHMSQIWAQAAAHHYGLNKVRCFSGGTEATAFNPRAVRAMKKAGMKIEVNEPGDNPVYSVKFSDDGREIRAFSKKYDNSFNPKDEFCAVMTCSHADENCPFIPGAESRVSIPYQDPKEFDGTDKEEQMYEERSRQIASEMFYLFSRVEK